MMAAAGSSNSANPYRCTSCKFVTASYEQWQLHLTTWLHQEKLYNTPGHGEAELELPHVREFVIVVSRVPLDIPLIDVANHFCRCGPIANIVFGGKELHVLGNTEGPTKQIFVVFAERSAVLSAVEEENAWLCGKRIGIRPLVGQLQLGRETAFAATLVRQEHQDIHERNGLRSSPFDQWRSQGARMNSHMDFTSDDDDLNPSKFRFEWERSSRNDSPVMEEMNHDIRDLEIPNPQQDVHVPGAENRNSSYDTGRMEFTAADRASATYNPSEFRFSWERSPGRDSPIEEEMDNHVQATTSKAATITTAEDSSWEMDTDDEDNPLDDPDKSSFEQIRKGKIRVNQSLRKYFEMGISRITGADDILFMDVRKKFQSLWLQYIIEFNSKFWTLCFGFELDSLYAEPDFAKTDSQTSLTLKQRFDSIPVDNDSSNLEYLCSTSNNVISDLIYKKKVWKKKFMLSHIRALWTVVTGNVVTKCKDGIDLSSVQKRVKLAPSKKMEFNVRLDVTFDLRDEDDIPSNDNIAAFVNLFLRDVSYNEKGRSLRNKKLRFLVSVYEKLAMRYCNLRIKQWIGSCEDIEFESFDDSYKKDKKREKRKLEGHPRWRKFKRKWSLILKERQETEERCEKMAKLEHEKVKAKRLLDEKKTPEELQQELELEKNYGWPRVGIHTVFDKDRVSVKEISGAAGISIVLDNQDGNAVANDKEIGVVESNSAENEQSGINNGILSIMYEMLDKVVLANKELTLSADNYQSVEFAVPMSDIMDSNIEVEVVSQESDNEQPSMEIDEKVEEFHEELAVDLDPFHIADNQSEIVEDNIEILGEKIQIDTELHVEVVDDSKSQKKVKKKVQKSVNGEQLGILLSSSFE